MTPPSDILLLFGRFHPLLVHLPIGLIVLLAFLELLARSPRLQKANASAGMILALAVPASIATAVCGWLLSLRRRLRGPPAAVAQMDGHRVAALCTGLGRLYWLALKKAVSPGAGRHVRPVDVRQPFRRLARPRQAITSLAMRRNHCGAAWRR